MYIIGKRDLLIFALGKNDEAIDWLKRAAAAVPESSVPQALLAAVFALKGRDIEAHEALKQYFTHGRLKTIAQWKALRAEADTPAYLAYRERLYEGLRKAGMPEE